MKRLLTVIMVLSLFAGGCSGTGDDGKVTVLASWTGDEEKAFKQVLDAFEADTGISYNYQGTRAVEQVLASDVQRGAAPDVAVLPNPGVLAKYQKSGDLLPLDGVLEGAAGDSYGQQWLALQKIGKTKQYAVAVKADLKSLIWYNPAQMTGPKPTTWADLVAFGANLTAKGGTPWCVGMGAPPTSGWPGTDWIEDILLHSAGRVSYWAWSSGKLAWTSAEIEQAWRDWGSVVAVPGAVRGGTAAALFTDFADAGKPMFTKPPGCALEHQASFVMSRYQLKRADGTSPRPGTDFDFLRFPGRDAYEVSADLAGMFRDTPEARRLIAYLSSEKAQRIWPGIPGASAFSVHPKVGPDVYADPVSRRIAETLTSVPDLCFDASDLMPAPMSGAFHRAVLEYLSNPERLNILLAQLEKIRMSIPADQWLDIPCGQ